MTITFPKLQKFPIPARTPQEGIGVDRARSNGTLGGINGTRGTRPRA